MKKTNRIKTLRLRHCRVAVCRREFKHFVHTCWGKPDWQERKYGCPVHANRCKRCMHARENSFGSG